MIFVNVTESRVITIAVDTDSVEKARDAYAYMVDTADGEYAICEAFDECLSTEWEVTAIYGADEDDARYAEIRADENGGLIWL